MNYYNQFENFDPVKDQLPYWPISEASNVAWRARSILHGRTKEEIKDIAHDASSIIDAYFDSEKDAAIQMIKDAGRYDLFDGDEDGQYLSLKSEAHDEFDIRDRDSTSNLDALQDAMTSFFDPTVIDVADLKDYEYFAAMALWFLGDYIKILNYDLDLKAREFIKRPNKQYSTSDVSRMGSIIVQAMDAVSYAEKMRETLRTEKKYENRINKIQAKQQVLSQADMQKIRDEIKQELIIESKAELKNWSDTSNEIRHKPNRNVKKIVLDLFDENPRQYSSAEKAADYYLEVLQKQNIDRSHRTVADWIRERAREKGIRFR
jgi:hypothetical protein